MKNLLLFLFFLYPLAVFTGVIEFLYVFDLVFLVIFLIVDILTSRKTKLIHIWIIGYIMVFSSEGIFLFRDTLIEYGELAKKAAIYISITNWVVVFTYFLSTK